MRISTLFLLVALGIPSTYAAVVAFPSRVDVPELYVALEGLNLGTVDVQTRADFSDFHVRSVAVATITMTGNPVHRDARGEASAVANLVLDHWPGKDPPVRVDVNVQVLRTEQGVPVGGVEYSIQHTDSPVGWRQRKGS